MNDGWVDGFEKYTIPGRPGLSYRANPSFRYLIHSTESSTADSAIGQYLKGTGCPHFTVEYGRNLRYQHVPVNLGSYALRNDVGGVQTNAIPCVQIEWVGFAKNGRYKSLDELQWFAEVLTHIAKELVGLGMIDQNFELVWPEFFDDQSGFTLATKNAKQRVSGEEWYSPRWTLYGHQHAPENTHWDPGKIDWVVVSNHFDSLFKKEDPVAIAELQEDVRKLEKAVAGLRARNKLQSNSISNLQSRVTQLETDGRVDDFQAKMLVLRNRLDALELSGIPVSEEDISLIADAAVFTAVTAWADSF